MNRYQIAVVVARCLDRVEVLLANGKLIGPQVLTMFEALTIEFAQELRMLNVKQRIVDEALQKIRAKMVRVQAFAPPWELLARPPLMSASREITAHPGPSNGPAGSAAARLGQAEERLPLPIPPLIAVGLAVLRLRGSSSTGPEFTSGW